MAEKEEKEEKEEADEEEKEEEKRAARSRNSCEESTHRVQPSAAERIRRPTDRPRSVPLLRASLHVAPLAAYLHEVATSRASARFKGTEAEVGFVSPFHSDGDGDGDGRRATGTSSCRCFAHSHTRESAFVQRETSGKSRGTSHPATFASYGMCNDRNEHLLCNLVIIIDERNRSGIPKRSLVNDIYSL